MGGVGIEVPERHVLNRSKALDIDARAPLHSLAIFTFWSMLGFRIPGGDPFSQSVSSVSQSVSQLNFPGSSLSFGARSLHGGGHLATGTRASPPIKGPDPRRGHACHIRQQDGVGREEFDFFKIPGDVGWHVPRQGTRRGDVD